MTTQVPESGRDAFVVTQPGAPREARTAATDDADRVSGAFRFAIHRRLAGTAHVVAVRSKVPHGRILSIDNGEAVDAAGVICVVTGAQARELLGERLFHGERRADQPVIAVDKVRYVGEPVALVVAETRSVAEATARLINVEIDQLPYVTNEVAAGEPGAPLVHDNWPGNDCGSATLFHGGDAEAALASAAYVHTATYTSPTASHAPLEPHVASAVWLDEAHLEVWSGTQSAWQMKARLAKIFGLREADVRVRADPIGGAFGSKLDMKLEGMVALASWFARRPVRMELSREEVFVTAAKHAATVTIGTGCDAQARLVGRVIDITYNAGAYAVTTPRALATGMIRSPGPYAIPAVAVRARARYTNTVPTGPFRGAMTGQVCFAGESAIDELAAQAGIDPLEFRRRNVIQVGDEYATGEAMTDVKYAEIVDDLARGIGWDEPLPPARPGYARGRGVGLVIKSTRAPSRSEASVVVDQTGAIQVWCSAVEMGQGAHKTMSEMAAHRLGVPTEQVQIIVVDTDYSGFDAPTSSARTTLMTGGAVEDAVDDLERRLGEVAAAHWGLTPGEVVHERATVRSAGGDRCLPYADVVALSGRPEITGSGRFETPPGYGLLDPVTSQGLHTMSWHQGGVAVEVEVDLLTGRVRVLRGHGNSYAGRIIDLVRCKKQLEGGLIFGIGQALMEEVVFDGGELVNGNLSDYQIPSLLDAPLRISSTAIPADHPDALPHGLGENTVPPLGPAIANAIFAATGARVRDLPLTAERILQAISSLDGGPAK